MSDKLLEGLNKQQKEAVIYDKGPLLVLAGAGSGKTKVLTHKAAWHVREGRIDPQNVLLLTFTNKAANEMKERITRLIGSVPGFAGTFHSFCTRILKINGETIGIPRNFLIYDETDSKDLIKEILKEHSIPPESYNPSYVLSQISEAKNEMLNPLLYSEIAKGERQEKIFKIYSEYEKRLRQIDALDFDDLLLKTAEMLDKNKDVLSKWRNIFTHILVDEWQDTNKIQYKITKLIANQGLNFTAVGDSSQSIYSWRGADFRNINYLLKDYSQTIKVINLEQNYRSTQKILDAANSIIKKNTSHPILSLWTNKKGGEKINVYRASNELDEASFVASQIEKLSDSLDNLSDFAILYRTNAQSRVVEEALLHLGIPYVLFGGVRFYDRKEVKDILSYLRLLSNPKDKVSYLRIEKNGKRRLEKFLNFAGSVTNVNEYTTLELLDSVISKTGYLEKFNKDIEEDAARLENIKELGSVAASYPNLSDFLENVALVEAQQTEQGIVKSSLSDGGVKRNAVTLMTLHSAKGLEFPTVFIIGMEEGLFPHSRSLFDIQQLEEERRLAYVGITRAKNVLYLTYASKRLFFGQKTSNPPSRFIIDIPDNLLQGVDDYNGYSANGFIQDIN